MKTIKTLISLAIMFAITASGISFILLAFDHISLDQWARLFSYLLGQRSLQIFLAGLGALITLFGLIFPLQYIRGINRKRFITYKNPDGEIIISIVAIEEYIKKVAQEIPHITTIKSKVDFSRKGINIVSNVIVSSNSSIQEVSERIQMGVRNKVQAMLGVEENINMKIHVNKIEGEVGSDYVEAESQEGVQ